MSNHVSYSELNTLAECERKWWYRYLHKADTTQTEQQYRGETLHKLIGSWRVGGEDLQRMTYEIALEVNNGDMPEAEGERILWLFDRYKRQWGTDGHRVVATEYRVENPLPGTDLTVLTYVDELVQVPSGGLWAVERKSMKDWQRLNLLDVDPQVTITVWNLRQEFPSLKGVLYDAIRTHRFADNVPTLAFLRGLVGRHTDESKKTFEARLKVIQQEQRTEEPTESSFQRIPLTRTEQEIESAVTEMYAGATRVADLRAGRLPIRNLGRQCDWCDHKLQCWADYRFGEVQ